MVEIIGKLINSRYRIDTFLGKGAMAEVYKVWDMERNVHLAMKILHADLAEDRVFLRRFKREAETLSTLQHPNIVRFYGMERDGDLVYMLMDYIDGVTLRKEIFQKEEPFSLERTLEVMRAVCSALYYAHKLGFVHCDVKPANIMLQKNGNILVADFGISRMTEASTATMVGAGTPAYMSPEQIMGSDPSPQMDIYALGVVLFEMLTGGERPFTGDNAKTTGTNSEKVRWEQLRLPVPPPSKYNIAITDWIDAVILKCLEKDHLNRYSDAMDLYRNFHEAVNSSDQLQPVQNHIQERQSLQVSATEGAKSVTLSLPDYKVLPTVTNKDLIFRIGLIAIGVLTIALIVVSSAMSSYQKSISITGTAQESSRKATATQQASYLFATTTKLTQNAQATASQQARNTNATATKQEQQAHVTATAEAKNAQATATANSVYGIVPNEIRSDIKIIKFYDNFAKNSSWDLSLIDDSSFYSGNKKLETGKFVWNVDKILNEGFVAWETAPEIRVRDFYLQIDAKRIGGTRSYSCYGLVFRETDSGYYSYSICDDQNYEIAYYDQNKGWETIRYGWVDTGTIRPGETNTLGVKAVAEDINLYVNGVEAYSFSDAHLSSAAGKVSFAMVLYDSKPVKFEFDNFIVLTP